MIKPEELKAVEFDLSVIGGYKRETVDSFFNEVTADYTKLFTENNELAQKLKVCIEKIEEYQKDEQFLKAAIINAEKLNENSLKDIEAKEKEIIQFARDKAENIVEKAKLEAENILKTARIDAEEAIKQCEIETAQKISELKLSVDAETEKLNKMKKEVADFKESVLDLYKEHLNSISKLPDFVPESPEKNIQNEAPAVEETEHEIVQESEEVAEAVVENKFEEFEPEPMQDKNVSSQKTAEFIIAKKSPESKTEKFEHNFKFQGLKFGADFDIRNDE